MWSYNQAYINGSKANPQKGDYVVIELQEDSDPETIHYKHLVWTFDATKTKAQFIAMVRAEVKALLSHLNTASQTEDATEELRPAA